MCEEGVYLGDGRKCIMGKGGGRACGKREGGGGIIM